ncbi:MAG: hypothetical protein ABI380_10005 [Edaphobacter sp.]
MTHYFVIAILIAAGVTQAQPPSTSISRISFEGTVGQGRIGLTLLVNSAGAITGGHYFHANDLKDIPLQAGTQGTGIVLYEPGGGQFALRFKGNSSRAGKPPSFQNSTGMEGRWMRGASSYPVELHTTGTTEGRAHARWYESVTSESDAAFEARAQGFYNAVLAGDRATAARYVDFPLRVNHNGKSQTIRSAAELSSQWDRIFTSACVDAIKDALPHDMFVRNGLAMLGDGVVWFGPKGAESINIP